MIGCFRTRVRKHPIIALYFELENELKFYNLEAGHIRASLFYGQLARIVGQPSFSGHFKKIIKWLSDGDTMDIMRQSA